MAPEYRFILRYGDPEQTHEVRPVWKDDLAIEWAMESQQWFHRSGLSGQLVLQREDYALVMSQEFGTVFYLDIYMFNGSSWRMYWQGKFTLTDCTVNVDDKKLSVKVQVVDDYNEILAGWEKEYDLIKLLPEMQKIKITKRPMIQIYSEGATYINCFIGQVYFEQDVEVPSADDVEDFMVNHCHFKTLSDLVEMNFENPPSGFVSPFTGTLANGNYLTNTDGVYHIRYYEKTEAINQTTVNINGLQVLPVGSTDYENDTLWEFSQMTAGMHFDPLPITMEFEPKGGSTGTLTANRTSRYVYGRVVCNKPSDANYQTWPIRSDDIVPYNRNYKYCLPYDGTWPTGTQQIGDDLFRFGYQGHSIDNKPTEWGMDDQGLYFASPGAGWLPLGRTNWVKTSDWYYPWMAASRMDTAMSHQYTMNNAYPVWSCLKVLLKEIAPDINFEANTSFSTFMFRTQVTQLGTVYSDPIANRDCRLFVTPKSNITAGEYETPAQTAPITLKTLLDMMAKTLNLHWFIERVDVGGGTIEKRLRIEHVLWFRNGGTYNGTQLVGVNLNTIKNVRNGKPWSFGTSEYSYEKADMPERYEFGWMDEVTKPFKGDPIEVVSPYVESGKIENVDVGQFSSDVDMMLLNPSAFSPDGFAVMTMQGDALPMTQYGSGYIQNGLLSFWKLQDPYWLYDMPAKKLKVNGQATNALGVSRNKSQTVNIPYDKTEPDLQKLVTTGIGNGQIRQLSIRLTSRMAKVQLRYDTEE